MAINDPLFFDTVNSKKKSITFINMPITSADEDKIGISQCASELKDVIKKGAQSIAITSDFGGGKSSLVRYLESKYSCLTTKFCYVNLWSQIESSDSENLHKSFIYQLASQISLRKGNYVSRRLSQNYGMLGITLPSIFSTILSFIMFFIFAIGFLCTTLYETVSEYIAFDFYNTHHKEIGVASFVVATFLALILIYKSDIIFSSKNSETNRKIDEHELMDIYKSYICKFHFKHYIVVIEDLDRSNKKNVNKFIKELRRYYIPYKHKRSKWRLLNWLYDTFFKNINRITFIVNIKSENKIARLHEQNLYSKAFDYVLNLKEINVDNYDVILEKLLEENRKLFIENGIPILKDGKYIPELEWIIRGKKVGLREIKTRLSTAISAYLNLCSKFSEEYISLEKCIAASYVMSEFEKEFFAIKEIGFDSIIDLYATNPKISDKDIVKAYDQNEISPEFAEDIRTLIDNGLIDSDYRQYFFNFPSNSYLHSNKQNQLIHTILYDRDVSEQADFCSLVSEIIRTDSSIITNTFDRLKRLGKHLPNCIFFSKELFDLALEYDVYMTHDTLGEKLQYDSESISSTAKIIIGVVKSNLIDKQEHIDTICDTIMTKAQPRALVTFRRLLIDNFKADIIKFTSLFFGECPLITKAEVDDLKDNPHLLSLINFESSELTMELATTIHNSILSGFDCSNENILNDVADFYEKLYDVLGATENETLTQYMFEIMQHGKVINHKLEDIIITNNLRSDILEDYVGLVCMAVKDGKLSENTLHHINSLSIYEHLCEDICLMLRDNSFYRSFIVNAYSTNIELIDFKDKNIITAINLMDFLNEDDDTVSEEMLLSFRRQILLTVNVDTQTQYRSLFMSPYPIINSDELKLIPGKQDALGLIDSKQLSEENYAYVADYFCNHFCSLNDSYEILLFICSIDDKEIKRQLFLCMDFNMIQYYRISAQRKNEIVKQMSDVFDFEDISEQIAFMSQTKCTHSPFEKEIKKAFSTDKNEELHDKYAKYIRSAKNVTNEMINTLSSLGWIYKMPSHVLDKLFSAKKYTYYVASKTYTEDYFTFETDKLDILSSAYENILLSKEGAYGVIKDKMAENEDFISYMRDKKLYENTSEYTRLWFSFCKQNVDCLCDLFDNYDDEFVIKYLCQSKGFEDKDAALYFIEKIKENATIAESDGVYENNYEKLLDSALKSNLTRYHNNAKNS